ncbi:DUF2442 domain-containing protein [Phormidium pseudopriestleyi FRX01]|uniref:DUF2442 domain-containing protein n=1 Tax=Phormidium pseudopriestleyi FRX01 TaxID=1759528 RepID=A0ABS3FKZ4_9CYAN|nr:DUF2442 domain-containing protein [Phormidium pseudopriestleyi]MBO0347776.1 DUF2442 domain-containing protein [Phormidium pseudopriestleyi FRX01]
MKIFHIVSVKAINDRILLVKFTNQETRKYDITKLLEKPMFAPLRNIEFFNNFRIEPGGYGLVWNDEIDISEYELWQNGISVTDEELEQYREVVNVDQ